MNLLEIIEINFAAYESNISAINFSKDNAIL